MLRNQLRPALLGTLALMLLTGALYPGLVTVLAQALFPHQANGSLVERGGRVVGSALIAQGFAGAHYFHPRPSAAGAGYDATASGGSNQGPTDRALADTLVGPAADSLRRAFGAARVPADMVTRSGSGLDPHISPANAALQAGRVAAARGVPLERVEQLVARHTEGRQLGFLGEPRVNVLVLNLALDRELPRR